LLGHIETPQLNSPRTDFTQFFLSIFIFIGDVKEIDLPTTRSFVLSVAGIAKCIVGNLVVSICLGRLAVM